MEPVLTTVINHGLEPAQTQNSDDKGAPDTVSDNSNPKETPPETSILEPDITKTVTEEMTPPSAKAGGEEDPAYH
jgi:hypothetical protein